MTKDIKKNIIVRLFLVYGAVLLTLVAVIIKIMVIQNEDPATWGDKQFALKEVKVDPFRGEICASDGRILATSMPVYSVHWDFQADGLRDTSYSNNIDSLSACMSKLFKDKTKEQYRSMFDSARAKKSRYFLVKDKVAFTDINKVKKFPIVKLGRNRSGIIITDRYRRVRPHNSLAGRTIGYYRDPGEAVGLEERYNSELKGIEGRTLMARLSSGDYYPVNDAYDDENSREPVDGNDIITTLSVNIQDIAERALEQQLKRHQAKHGNVIVMEVKTGKIRAMVNLDLLKDSVTYAETYNNAIATVSEPGSTFKLPALITVLEEKGYGIEEEFDLGEGFFDINGNVIRDDHPLTGPRSIKEIFEKSSNVGMAKLVMETFKNDYNNFITRLYNTHINAITEIDITGETQPTINSPDKKTWWAGSPAKMAYGYEVLVTPLQILTLYNAVANDGVMMKPHLLEAVRSHGEIIRVIEPEILVSSVCGAETLKKVRTLLQGVVENGTAKTISSEKYSIAGKTGTAQIAKGKSGYKDEENSMSYLASFVGYFPAEKPKYSCIVTINSPSKISYYGATVAGPVFRAISDKLYSMDRDLSVKTDFDLMRYKDKESVPYAKGGNREILDRLLGNLAVKLENSENSHTPWVKAAAGNKAVRIDPVADPKAKMPDVRGMGLRDALYLLRNKKLNVVVEGRGAVVKQSILPDTPIKTGMKVIIELDNK